MEMPNGTPIPYPYIISLPTHTLQSASGEFICIEKQME